ncbi:hypothetical protein H8E50_01285 [bacterium]|nr:hypothetical protein [bacterium]
MILQTIKNRERIEFVRAAFSDLSAVEELIINFSRLSKEVADYSATGTNKDRSEFHSYKLKTDTSFAQLQDAVQSSQDIGGMHEDQHIEIVEQMKSRYDDTVQLFIKIMDLADSAGAGKDSADLVHVSQTYWKTIFRDIEKI